MVCTIVGSAKNNPARFYDVLALARLATWCYHLLLLLLLLSLFFFSARPVTLHLPCFFFSDSFLSWTTYLFLPSGVSCTYRTSTHTYQNSRVGVEFLLRLVFSRWTLSNSSFPRATRNLLTVLPGDLNRPPSSHQDAIVPIFTEIVLLSFLILRFCCY